jgi:outer membrane protein, heavy metal efflux system
MMRFRTTTVVWSLVLVAGRPAAARAQRSLTLRDAIDAAVARGTRVALARADSATARAGLTTAREWPNPSVNFQYTRDTPHYHGFLEIPIDYPWLRHARIHSADLANRSAAYRFAFERAAAGFDAETAYVRAQVAAAHSQLSSLNAVAADSLRRLALIRRDAGDASELDVELANVNAGQTANVASTDSLTAAAAVLDLQALIGLAADTVLVVLTDSLTLPDTVGVVAAAAQTLQVAAVPRTLQVAAAEEALASEQAALHTARRGAFAQPQLSLGVEGGDPSQPFPLPAAGIILPLPLFNQNGGQVATERANLDRAQAQLAQARRESAAAIATARRELAAALARARRDLTLLTGANRVATMSLTAFAEGAQPLTSVLEARRSARDALAQYVDDIGAARAALAAVRLFTTTVDLHDSRTP